VTAPGTDVTVEVCATVTESSVSVAVYVTAPAGGALDREAGYAGTVVVADAGEIVEPAGAPASEIDLPGTGCSCASRSVGVTVAVDVPSW
jgi:hypothetical protein